MMDKLTAFVQEHMGDDLTRLVLDRKKWPDIDIDLAVSSIQSRRKLKGKVQEWFSNPSLIFPAGLSAEQCSSTATAVYKAGLAARIASSDGDMDAALENLRGGWRLADLTGGLGVDSWMFSKFASEVLYNEMQEKLCMAAEHNFKALGADNIRISNQIAAPDTIMEILGDFGANIIYMDPARRGEGGKKVFLIEECTPDVLTLKDIIFERCRHILLKLSPMADITMVCDRLGSSCRQVHVVATGGECKELLIWMDREWEGEYEVVAVELPAGYPDVELARFSFKVSEEKISPLTLFGRNDIMPSLASREDTTQASRENTTLASRENTTLASREESRDLPHYLFEPGKALMKAGCYNLISERFGLHKLGRSTHYYITEDATKAETLKQLGKVYEIIDCQPLDKRTMKAAGRDYPRAEVTARNIPMDTDTFRKKLGVSSGDDAHIFGLKSDTLGNLLIITRRW